MFCSVLFFNDCSLFGGAGTVVVVQKYPLCWFSSNIYRTTTHTDQTKSTDDVQQGVIALFVEHDAYSMITTSLNDHHGV